MAMFESPFTKGAQSKGPAFRADGQRPPQQNNNSGGNNGGNSGSGNDSINDPNNGNNGGNGNNGNNGSNNQEDPNKNFWGSKDANNVGPDGKPVAPPEFKGYWPELPADVVSKGIANMQFDRDLPPEIIAAISKGDPEVEKALRAMLNHVGRKSFAASHQATSAMSKRAFQTAEDRFMGNLVPDAMRKYDVENRTFSKHPMANDPQWSGLFKATRDQFVSQYPQANPEQIEEGVTKYMDDFIARSQNLKGGNNTPTNQTLLKQGSDEANWEEWVGM